MGLNPVIDLKRALILFVGIVIGAGQPGFCQIQKITDNNSIMPKGAYYKKENPGDTVFIVFETQQERAETVQQVRKVDSHEFEYKLYAKTYPPPTDSCVMLRFYHEGVLGHEKYLISKSELDEKVVLIESELGFNFWFENTEMLFQKTLILIEADDWCSDRTQMKGVGVQISTFASCDDLIEEPES